MSPFKIIKELSVRLQDIPDIIDSFLAEYPEILNIRQLAEALGRDYKNVYTDVSQLEEPGLIEKGVKGVLSVPYDEIVIHAGLTKAA